MRAHGDHGIGPHLVGIVFQLVDRTLDEEVVAVKQIGVPVPFVAGYFTHPAAAIKARQAGGKNADLAGLRQKLFAWRRTADEQQADKTCQYYFSHCIFK